MGRAERKRVSSSSFVSECERKGCENECSSCTCVSNERHREEEACWQE